MKTNCKNCNKELERSRYRALKGNCYCQGECQMNYEYKTGVRDKSKITKGANLFLKNRTKQRFKENKANTMISKRGYNMIYTPQGWIKEHHIIWVTQSDWRFIPKDFVVHHINEDKLDNRIENLACIPKDFHLQGHYQMRKINKLGQLI